MYKEERRINLADFKIEKGSAATLSTARPSTDEGRCYFTTDEHKFYIDLTSGTDLTQRVPLNAEQANIVTSTVSADKNYVCGVAIANGEIHYNSSIYTEGSVLHGAGNDYAEYRLVTNTLQPGRVVVENGDDTLSLSQMRLQPAANIISDTFGFVIGDIKYANAPLAVSGRVLAYPLESKEEFIAGDPVCSGPYGTVSKMTREEVQLFPDRMIGTVSAIPDYEYWGENNIPVDGRIWIKVR